MGSELMHHVHAADVAQAFQLAIEHPDSAGGQSFNVAASTALTVRGFLAIAASWFGQSAHTRSVSWEEFRAGTSAESAEESWQHLSRSHYVSIDKARTLLGYAPAYEPEAAVLAGVRSLVTSGKLRIANPLIPTT
jgi:nucleoside-diphosphate-sugar epimerase